MSAFTNLLCVLILCLCFYFNSKSFHEFELTQTKMNETVTKAFESQGQVNRDVNLRISVIESFEKGVLKACKK